MSNWPNNLCRSEGGGAAVEFAIVVPFLLLLLAGFVELGRFHYQASAVERGLRAGAIFAARVAHPLGAADEATAVNLVKTATLDGSGPLLVSGWAAAGAGLTITTGSFSVGEATFPVIRFAASVPFDPILPGLVSFVGLDSQAMSLSHEQAYVGD